MFVFYEFIFVLVAYVGFILFLNYKTFKIKIVSFYFFSLLIIIFLNFFLEKGLFFT
jgi:hypothetical protein